MYDETNDTSAPTADALPGAPAPVTHEVFAKRIQMSWQKRTSSIFAVAEACNEANAQLVGKPKKNLFDALPFSKATFVKLSQIGGDSRLRGITDRLPASFSIIYEITLLSDEQFGQAVASNKIRPKVRRDEIIKLREVGEDSDDGGSEGGEEEQPVARFEAGKLYQFKMPTDEKECDRISKVLAKFGKNFALEINPA